MKFEKISDDIIKLNGVEFWSIKKIQNDLALSYAQVAQRIMEDKPKKVRLGRKVYISVEDVMKIFIGWEV